MIKYVVDNSLKSVFTTPDCSSDNTIPVKPSIRVDILDIKQIEKAKNVPIYKIRLYCSDGFTIEGWTHQVDAIKISDPDDELFDGRFNVV